MNKNGCKLYSIYANPEHVHFLVSRSPKLDEESLATVIANSSAKFINDNKLSSYFFQWQQSCAAFSVSKQNVRTVCEYIEKQKEHHKKEGYDEEYKRYLEFYQQPTRKKGDG